ncbi:SusC/RagA family TonB-linked outer membrane protein [Cyclobacterium salsum]|uniref:SusC/RagA family TonB-linked outer membrane protein n=1 Tax=Cyclobacterium salsum TaxID=2666329 RepID=UPI001F242901|nr:SusC/RagA family TonB-linked outer membrane protein [Cyclobacterium salsum]
MSKNLNKLTKVFCMMVLFSLPFFANAQTTVSGVVSDETGFGIPGVTILLKGTSEGTVTDFDGKYKIEIDESDAILVFSSIGFDSQEIDVGTKNQIDVVLKEDVTGLTEIVVTALGVEREEKALGYSVQRLDGEDLATVKAINPINGLSGKLSGVYITGSGNGPTASANITIRGAASLLGNNQPLFVVNGMPITNDLYSFDDGINGSTTIDFGNASQIVNSDDIASINVLKGPAASALYGSRAANGVILIETKTGQGSDTPMGVEINSSTTFENILRLPDFQNEYGFGADGKYSYVDGSNYIGPNESYEAYGENWGPRMNGQLIKQFNSNGEPVPFTPAPNNIRNFFRTGITSINNIALNNSDENGDSRFSYTNLGNKGIAPNTNLNRNTLQASIGRRLLDDRLKIRVNSMYVASNSDNVPNAGYDESSSIMYGWLWYPRQVEINDLKNYWEVPGVQQRYVEDLWVNNPWLVAKENTNSFKSNRFITNLRANYDFSKNFSARFRYGADVLDEERQYRRAPSTKGVLRGSYREDEVSFSETNAELLFTYNTDRDNLSNFDLDVSVGGNIMKQNANFLVANNPELAEFGDTESIYTLANARSGVLVESQKTETGINSLFGTTTLSYLNSLFLEASFRNDWNSTLVNPMEGLEGSNFSFGYPSVAVSAVLSDLLDISRQFAFLQLKGSFAEVGNGAPPYSFGNTFAPQPAFGSQTAYTTNTIFFDPDLKPERTQAWEAGVDARFFEGRLRVDLTYYEMLSFDQIIDLPVAKTSGFEFYRTNGGEISNRGLELTVAGRVIDNKDLKWDVMLNAGRNRSVIESLPDIISSGRYSIIADLFPGDEGGSDLEFVAEEGKLLGQLYGLGFERGPDGRIIHQDGIPMMTDEKVSAGSFQPDWRIGINNSFTYRNLTLNVLFDGQIGGKIYSRSHALYGTSGAITNNDDPNLPLSTMEGRRVHSVAYDSDGNPVYTMENAGGVVGPGWNWTDGNADGAFVNEDGSFQTEELTENDVVVPAGGAQYTGYFYQYYGNGFNRDNIEAATYDATYVKLRELSISYAVPTSLTSQIGIPRASVSFIGRNLLLFTNVPSIDPETFSIRNGIFVNGFESTQLPSTRSYGFSINLDF